MVLIFARRTGFGGAPGVVFGRGKVGDIFPAFQIFQSKQRGCNKQIDQASGLYAHSPPSGLHWLRARQRDVPASLAADDARL